MLDAKKKRKKYFFHTTLLKTTAQASKITGIWSFKFLVDGVNPALCNSLILSKMWLLSTKKYRKKFETPNCIKIT